MWSSRRFPGSRQGETGPGGYWILPRSVGAGSGYEGYGQDVCIPGTCLSSILVVEPFKTRSLPIKTRVIWVPGTNYVRIHQGYKWFQHSFYFIFSPLVEAKVFSFAPFAGFMVPTRTGCGSNFIWSDPVLPPDGLILVASNIIYISWHPFHYLGHLDILGKFHGKRLTSGDFHLAFVVCAWGFTRWKRRIFERLGSPVEAQCVWDYIRERPGKVVETHFPKHSALATQKLKNLSNKLWGFALP